MLATAEFPAWCWLVFIAVVIVCIALDLGLFHRRAHAVGFKEALTWTAVWAGLAVAFAAGLSVLRGKREAVQFFTGYFLELSLSVDNVFVIVLVFSYFRVAREYQHRVLIWGVLGALAMRGMMIGLGAELINEFDWVLYLFGAFLILSGLKMLLAKDAGADPEKSLVVRAARKLLPISQELDGQKFLTRINGRLLLTPLFLVLLAVETTDLLFAVDSIPAVFGVTRKAFIVFTSNVFAILGLRSLYFVVAGAIGSFRYLKVGISLVLAFIGLKMLIDPHDHPPKWFQWDMPDPLALVCVVVIIALSVLASMIASERERRHGGGPKTA